MNRWRNDQWWGWRWQNDLGKTEYQTAWTCHWKRDAARQPTTSGHLVEIEAKDTTTRQRQMRLVHVLFGATLEKIQVKSLEATCISWWFPSLQSSKRTSPQIADPKEVCEVDVFADMFFFVHAIPKFREIKEKHWGQSSKSREISWGEVFRKAWGKIGRWGNTRERWDWWKVQKNMFSSLVGKIMKLKVKHENAQW